MSVRHLSDGTDDGTTLGQSTSDKISFYGVTTVVQPSSASQAAVASSTTTTATTTNLQKSIDVLVTLVNQMRSDLVTIGILKGSA